MFILATPFAENGTVAAPNADRGLTADQLAELASVGDRHQQRIKALQEERRAEHMRQLAELGIKPEGTENERIYRGR